MNIEDPNIMLLNAIKLNNVENVKEAINNGANVNYIDANKTSPLMYAVIYGRPAISEYLLKSNANINFIYGKDRVNLLYVALEYRGRFYKSNDIIELLIRHGISINHQDKYGNTALHLACSTYGVIGDVIGLLIKNGADMDIKNNYGLSPYSMSIENNMAPLKKILDSLRNK
jgi:ankyrin repeat protein